MKKKLFMRKHPPATSGQTQAADGFMRNHRARIEKDLRNLGADAYDEWLPETHLLPEIIHPDEVVQGIVYGKYTYYAIDQPASGRGVLVVTNQRVLHIDRKPLFTKIGEISFQSVSAVSYSKVGLGGTVILHTRLGTFKIRTFNQKCARSFVAAVENNLLTPNQHGGVYESISDA
jgi:hypothetical protein